LGTFSRKREKGDFMLSFVGWKGRRKAKAEAKAKAKTKCKSQMQKQKAKAESQSRKQFICPLCVSRSDAEILQSVD